MAHNFAVGTRAWQPDQTEGWVASEVVEKVVDGDKVKLVFSLENGETKTIETTEADLQINNNSSLPPLMNPAMLEASEDLTNLSHLNEPAVLQAIKLRYYQKEIYTYSGIVLIATNPFARVDSLYVPQMVQVYAGKQRASQAPHLFAIAEEAFADMLRDSRNQTIVVSGESGAGKTVSAKYIMRYFATRGTPDEPGTYATGRADSISKTEEQILATNPVMEAFGNAKTTRNDNSSRFGKYIEIMFDSKTNIIGAKIRTYLLERSRLVFQPLKERNYHIFYQLVAGATESERQDLNLLSIEEFDYLNQGGTPVIDGVDDKAELEATKKSLATIGVPPDTQTEIFRILAALLHLGKVKITGTRTDSSLSPSEPSLVRACEMLGINPNGFAKWIVKKQLTTRGEQIISNITQQQAIVVRDSVTEIHLFQKTGNSVTPGRRIAVALWVRMNMLEAASAVREKDSASVASRAVAAPGRKIGVAVNRKPTLGGIFKSSLIELMNTINSTDVHYIRCIKPNEGKESWKFEGPMVLSQLRACGVLETVRISCAGYPTRWTYEEFALRYYMLCHSSQWTSEIREMGHAILRKALGDASHQKGDKYQLGLTKIFFRAGMLAFLENLRTSRLNECAIMIQKNLKCKYYRRRYLQAREAILTTQSLMRGFIARKYANEARRIKAATTIQRVWRGQKERKRYLAIRRNVILFESLAKGYLCRRNIMDTILGNAAKIIQRAFRSWRQLRAWRQYRRKVVTVQNLWRALGSLKQQNKTLVSQVENYEGQLKHLRGKNNTLEARTRELQAEANQAGITAARLAAMEEDMAKLQQGHTEALSTVKKLQEEERIARESLRGANLELDKLRQTNSDNESDKASLRQQIADLQDELEFAKRSMPVNGADPPSLRVSIRSKLSWKIYFLMKKSSTKRLQWALFVTSKFPFLTQILLPPKKRFCSLPTSSTSLRPRCGTMVS
ncbi:MYO2 protein [Uncinocarpus reesii 1704]|uniref:MYO2 protein n=1 Tax=Uncinocarpus reesii (strain UAMH 1704) TaxID=336963 RepID=C4JMI1_UNCRE|nr:MYO2 protein [Uncinocarpus reesii 1704]EEP79193.1 MYO2 protein [Uncinocarpus reesii 1704]